MPSEEGRKWKEMAVDYFIKEFSGTAVNHE
jgi:hypothetical protein